MAKHKKHRRHTSFKETTEPGGLEDNWDAKRAFNKGQNIGKRCVQYAKRR